MLTLVGIYAAHLLGMASIESVHRMAFSLILKGKTVTEIDQLIAQFLHEQLDALFCPLIVARVKEAKKSWLLSSSPFCIVHPVAKRLGIETVFATTYHVDAEGRYRGIKEIVTGTTKRAYLDAYRKTAPCRTIAYSDSIHDMPLLEGVDEPIVIRPDRRLKKEALSRGWKLLRHT